MDGHQDSSKSKVRSPGPPAQTTIVNITSLEALQLMDDHDGVGPILFRRVFDESDVPEINFVDFTEVPPGSAIGTHSHNNTVEIYFIVSGNPLVTVDERVFRLHPSGISVVLAGSSHSLINDTQNNVQMLVIEVNSHEIWKR